MILVVLVVVPAVNWQVQLGYNHNWAGNYFVALMDLPLAHPDVVFVYNDGNFKLALARLKLVRN